MATPAEPAKVSGDLLTKKVGPLAVWIWAGLGLGGAYLYSKHKASTAASSTSSTTAAGEPASTPPQYVIENNLPGGGYTGGSGGTVTSTPPVVTPPNSGPTPPTTPIQGTPVAGPGGPIAAPPTTTSTPTAPVSYKVVSGDTLSSIAARYGTTAAALYAYNTTPGNRPASTIATLKQRGPNLIYAGETILIPQT